MKQRITIGTISIILFALPAIGIADIDTNSPTGHYYQYAVFNSSNSEFKGGYDVDSYEDLIYVNRDGSHLDVYQVTLQDSDGDGVLEPDQHPQNIGSDELLGTADDQVGVKPRMIIYQKGAGRCFELGNGSARYCQNKNSPVCHHEHHTT